MVTIEYNEELDILLVQEEQYEDFAQSVELGGYVLDLNSEQEFLGLEIIDASQNTPLDGNDLNNINDADVNLVKTEDYIRIEVRFTVDNHQNMITSQYPTSAYA